MMSKESKIRLRSTPARVKRSGVRASKPLHRDRYPRLESLEPRLALAAIVAHAPSSLDDAGGPLNGVVVTFDEAVEPASFDGADVELIDPQGQAIEPVVVTPVAGSDGTQFDLTFADQDLRGSYRLTVGPNVMDTDGDLMNQDGDATNGEANDAFAAVIPFTQTLLPLSNTDSQLGTERFEGWPPVPSHWSFFTDGTGTIHAIEAESPLTGTRHLEISQPGGGEPAQSAILGLDLSAVVGSVSLEFAAKTAGFTFYGQTHVELSGDGELWHEALSVDFSSNYSTRTLVLTDTARASGIATDGELYVRFRQESTGSITVLYLDDIRLFTGGPRVVGLNPPSLDSGELLELVTLEFDEPVDPATVNGDTITIVSPAGQRITPTAITPAAGSNDQGFEIRLPSQSLRGAYQVTVGPGVLDLAGDLMNQDGDGTNGESNGQDAFHGTIDLVPASVDAFPLLVDFEGGDLGSLGTHWGFSNAAPGAISVSADAEPRGGGHHLEMTQVGSGNSDTYAVLHLDLTDEGTPASGVSLDFWHKAGVSTSGQSGRVDIRENDEAGWLTIVNLQERFEYTHYTFDLDAEIAGHNLAFSDDFQIKFQHGTSFDNRPYYFDDIQVRVDGTDVIGPRVTDVEPELAANGSATGLVVSFNEPISGLTASEITLNDPTGQPVEIAGEPQDIDGQQSWRIELANAVSQVGFYEVQVRATAVTDLAGNLMNQDQDPINGEINGADDYDEPFELVASPFTGPFPLSESFEVARASDLAPHWSFRSTNGGQIEVTNQFGSIGAGETHFAMSGTASGATEEAILHLDLEGEADVALEFLFRGEGSTQGDGSLYIRGDDNAAWRQVGLLFNYDDFDYKRLTFDLDEIAAARNVPLTEDFQVRWLHHRHSFNQVWLIDDIKVHTDGTDIRGPRVLGHSPETVAAEGEPFTSVTLTFDEPIDTATLTMDDVVVKDPLGAIVAPLSVESVAGSDDTVVQVSFAEQHVRGTYRLQLLPEVADGAGNLLNQDGDPKNGEPNAGFFGHDDYIAEVTFDSEPLVISGDDPMLFAEDFESWSPNPHWSFVPPVSSFESPDIALSAEPPLHSGSQHLRTGPYQINTNTRAIRLNLDLSDRVGSNELFFEFWARGGGGNVFPTWRSRWCWTSWVHSA